MYLKTDFKSNIWSIMYQSQSVGPSTNLPRSYILYDMTYAAFPKIIEGYTK